MRKQEITANINPDEKVPVNWREQDYMTTALRFTLGNTTLEDYINAPIFTTKELARKQIVDFCDGCDLLKADGTCGLNDGERIQPIYVARGWCGWTQENKIRGQRTAAGFVPQEKP